METTEEDWSEEYAREAGDVLKALRSSELIRTRSMSPNFVRRRIRRGAAAIEDSDTQQDSQKSTDPTHLEDLPVQELEGAPAGWGRNRSRNSLSTSVQEPNRNRRNSAFPTAGPRTEMRRSSAAGRRRESQMTFDEWCQLKKFQELHESALKEHEESTNDLEHVKNMKRNISFDEWSKATEERQKRTTEELEKLKIKEEREKESMEMAKFRRKISFDRWVEDKRKITGDRQRKISDIGPPTVLMEEDRKKKSDEAHRKWLLKKELTQLQQDRKEMLRKSSIKTSEHPNITN